MFDVIIIGAGASGLFAAASFNKTINGLILNKSKAPGLKLLMAGKGQCNMTKSGDIKNFVTHYGNNGGRIRKALYKFSNRSLVDFFERNGIQAVEREDGKIFPGSMESRDVLELLLRKSKENGFSIRNNQGVMDIQTTEGGYSVMSENNDLYECSHLIVATGGCSYPGTGSDGSLFSALSKLGLEITKAKPALVPLFVENYGFSSLSGISFPDAMVTFQGHSFGGGLLLTHTNFSGPAILDGSRFAGNGESFTINYLPAIKPDHFLADLKTEIIGNQKQISTVITEILSGLSQPLPKRFLDLLCIRSNVDPAAKSSTLSGRDLKAITETLFHDSYRISGTAGFSVAMATAGGIALKEMNLTNFECKKYPRLYIIGEALDVDGDTGGYNIQFAFTSGHLCADAVSAALA